MTRSSCFLALGMGSAVSLLLQFSVSMHASCALAAGVTNKAIRGHMGQKTNYMPKGELLHWLNTLLHTDYSRVEQCANGAAYCQVLDSLFTVRNSSLDRKSRGVISMQLCKRPRKDSSSDLFPNPTRGWCFWGDPHSAGDHSS